MQHLIWREKFVKIVKMQQVNLTRFFLNRENVALQFDETMQKIVKIKQFNLTRNVKRMWKCIETFLCNFQGFEKLFQSHFLRRKGGGEEGNTANAFIWIVDRAIVLRNSKTIPLLHLLSFFFREKSSVLVLIHTLKEGWMKSIWNLTYPTAAVEEKNTRESSIIQPCFCSSPMRTISALPQSAWKLPKNVSFSMNVLLRIFTFFLVKLNYFIFTIFFSIFSRQIEPLHFHGILHPNLSANETFVSILNSVTTTVSKQGTWRFRPNPEPKIFYLFQVRSPRLQSLFGLPRHGLLRLRGLN